MTRRYLVRTYGCQMNEHDSERIAGVLAADGMEPTDDPALADVVVLNTCCIRENADNKLYAHLGDLKALKTQRPDVQIAVGGCPAQKDRQRLRDRAPAVAGSSVRNSPISSGRSTRSTASSASASRRRTPKTCGPRRSLRWPSARTCARTSIFRCSPAATARSRGCIVVTRRSGTCSACT